MATASPEVFLVAGKDPRLERGGGHSSYVRAHARAALAAGFRPRIFCVGDRTDILDTDYGTLQAVRSWLPIRGPEGTPRFLPLVPLHTVQLTRALARHLRQHEGPAVLHGFGPYGAAGVLAARSRGRGSRISAIWSAYTLLEHESRGRLVGPGRVRSARQRIAGWRQHVWARVILARYEARALRDATLTLINYESVQRLLAARHRVDARWRRVPYTSETAFLAPPKVPGRAPEVADLGPSRAPLVVAVSRHDPRKGVHVLIQALARLRRQGVSFRACLVGPGPLLEAHRRLSRDLGLDGTVAIPGLVEDPRSYLAVADVFALPSLVEGSGSVSLIEALEAGLAVVVSAVDGLPEDVSDGVEGYLVRPGDPDALAAALRQIVESPELRRRLGAGARRTYAERFAPERMVEALGEVYSELMGIRG
jgi:glycosyltransferase involved in cell wall biosynthesis